MKKLLLLAWGFLPLFSLAQNLPEEAFRQMEDSILKIMEKNKIPGMQFAIVNKDSIIRLGNLGLADVKNSVPVTDSTMFRIGSVSKSFVAVSLMQLVEQGKLSLDDRLADVAPEVTFSNRWEDTDPITLEGLLEHTTGNDDIHLAEYYNQAEGWTTLECLQFHPDSRTARWKPGRHMSYSNSGPVVVAYAIEKASGLSYEEYVKQNIFLPLGMVHSDLLYSGYVKEHLSREYTGDQQKETSYWHITGRPAGSVNSSAKEMASYVRMFLGRGTIDSTQILYPASVRRIETPMTTLAAKTGFTDGYGLNIDNKLYKGVRRYGHNGGMEGFLCGMGYLPSTGTGYVFMINSSNGGFGEIERAMLDALIPDSLVRTAEDLAVAGIDVDPKMTGWYRSATSRAQIGRFAQGLMDVIRISEEDGKYYYRSLFNMKKEVYPVRENILLYESEKHNFTPMVLVEDEDGILYLQRTSFYENYRKTTGFGVWSSLILAGICLLLMASSIIAALIWIPWRIISKKKFRFMAGRVMPLVTVLLLVAAVIPLMMGITGDVFRMLGPLTIYSGSFFFFSLAFAVFSFLSLITGLVSFRLDMNKWARIYSFLVSIACTITTVYLLYHGMIGLKTWAY